jgi:hypothetical protein
MENLTENTIYNSKQYVKNGFYFDEPSKTINTLIDITGPENISLQCSHPAEIAEDNNLITAYGRLAVIKSFEIDEEINYSVGYIYALNVGKPFVKVFSGVNVKACTNLCVFNSSHRAKFDILTDGSGAFEKVKDYIKDVNTDIENAKKIIFDMKNTFLNFEEVKLCLGQLLVNFSKTNNIAGRNCILSAGKLITDPQSRYYFENETTAWNLYNALTDNYRDSTHIIDHPEKVLALYEEIKKFKTFTTQVNLLLN